MTLSWPNHPITLEEWEALPEDSVNKLEVAEGMLVMSPRPLSWHQKAGCGSARSSTINCPTTSPA
jgi:hypothetical protein